MNINTICHHRLSRAICAEAMRFNNLKEIRPNAHFDNPATPGADPEAAEIIRLYKECGWQEGWAHCAAFADAIVCLALAKSGATRDQVARFTKLMQLGVVNSANAFASAGILTSRLTNKVEAGSIWLAQNGSTSQGHAGIVLAHESTSLSTIEANTSKDGKSPDKDREGDWITTRVFSQHGRGNLRTKGFVMPSVLCEYLNR